MTLFKRNFDAKSDEELMLLLSKGGQSAFDELYKRYSKPLLNFFFRMLNGNKEKAEDMLHDLFLKIIEKPENFDRNKKFKTWFYTLANNMVKNEYRSRQIRSEHEKQTLLNSNELFVFNSENYDEDLFNKRLDSELDMMDIELKTLFNLRFREEMSIKQIAEIIDCPEGTIKSRLFYLSKQLSKKLSIYKPEIN